MENTLCEFKTKNTASFILRNDIFKLQYLICGKESTMDPELYLC